MEAQSKNEQSTPEKTTYQTPEINDYDNIESLTQSGGSLPVDAVTGVSTID